MKERVKGRRRGRAEPGPPPPLTLFNTLITVQEDPSCIPDKTIGMRRVGGLLPHMMRPWPGFMVGSWAGMNRDGRD
jgi:hypothetical protein